MKNWYAAFLIGGSVLWGGPAIAETDMAQWTQLDDEYRIAIRERLSQKPMEEWSFNDLQLMAASVSKDVYGANPQLLRAKMLTDLETIPLWKGPSPTTFHEK